MRAATTTSIVVLTAVIGIGGLAACTSDGGTVNPTGTVGPVLPSLAGPSSAVPEPVPTATMGSSTMSPSPSS